MKTKKLLQLNATANWGSTGKIAEGIGLAALDRGWESYIAYGRYANPSKSELIKVGNKLDVYSHYAKSRFLNAEGLGSKSATKNLIKKIKELKPDIIQLHNIHDHWLNYPLLFKYLQTIDTQIVWTFHDCWAFTGGCSHFETINCWKWKKECVNCIFKSKYLKDNSSFNYNKKKSLFAGLGQRLHIITVSNWLSEFIKDSFLKEQNINIIHNGIDIETFKPSKSKRKTNSERRIIGVSNVWPEYKGLKDFIKLREILSPDLKITLVGLNKKQISGLPEGIEGIERTQNIYQLIEIYNSATAFINPTYNDSFPTVNLEALACGTPVITYRTGGSPEAIDENTGLIVEKGDVKGLAESINIILKNPNLYSLENCRSRAIEKFNRTTQFNKYIDVYENLLDKGNIKTD